LSNLGELSQAGETREIAREMKGMKLAVPLLTCHAPEREPSEVKKSGELRHLTSFAF